MRHRDSILVAAFLASICCISVSAQSKFTVGTASAAPGQKATGYLEVPEGVDAATSIPVVVVNGAKPGRVLALVTGAHGTEYVSIIADRKSTRLNSSHVSISYAVFCLKKKKRNNTNKATNIKTSLTTCI